MPAEGVPDTIEILAMAPAMFAEDEVEGPGFRYDVSDSDYEGAVAISWGDEDDARDRYRYGSGMIVHMPKGAGDVLTAGTCEWVMGLARNEPYTRRITRNVIERFSRR